MLDKPKGDFKITVLFVGSAIEIMTPRLMQWVVWELLKFLIVNLYSCAASIGIPRIISSRKPSWMHCTSSPELVDKPNSQTTGLIAGKGWLKNKK